MAISLDPQKDTTINLPDKQEGKGEYCLDCCQLSSGIRWSLFDFEFMYVMHDFVMSSCVKFGLQQRFECEERRECDLFDLRRSIE